jgi:hypothetical protein
MTAHDHDTEITMRVSTALNYSLNLYLMLLNSCGVTSDFDTAPSEVEVLRELEHLIDPADRDSGLLERYSKIVSRQFRAARDSADGGYFSPPIEHSLSDLASEFHPSDFGRRLAREQEDINRVLASASDIGIIERNLGVFLEISALAQPVGEYFRHGLLAVSVGHLEQHLTLLEACSGGVPSPVLEGKSRISTLIDSAHKRYGPKFDPGHTRTKEVSYVVAVRNSVIHREGRVDKKFLDAVGKNSVAPESHGKLLDMSVPVTSNYMSVVFGFAARASLFTWLSSDTGEPFVTAAIKLARHVFKLRHDDTAARFIDDIVP